MIQINIKKQEQITNQASFPTMEEAQAWLAYHEEMKSFGQPKQIIQQKVELSPAVLDEEGNELSPAITEMHEVELAGEYEIIIENISAKLEQEKINAEALAYLSATDFYIIRELDNGTPCPPEIKAERQAARDKIVK